MVESIVGRDAELASLREFVASISRWPAALVLEGEAGVGKTTLWTAGLDEAEEGDVCVLEARPTESETALSFSGIGDLLDPVLDDALASLPAPQRRALSRALLLDDDGPPPDPHAIGVGVLNAFRALAAEQPVLIAVDDVQWLDQASVAALVYGARRLRAERVGVMLARRTPSDAVLVSELSRSLPASRLTTVEVIPFDLTTLHHVVHDHLGVVLPRPVLAEIHEASAGNPFYALEIVRTLRRTGVSVEAGGRLPVPESLHDLVHGRLRALPAESRDYLLAAAALSHATVSLCEAACGVGRGAGLVPALEARIVQLEGDRIRFTHPLLAAGAYETADPRRRAEVHARLAELVEDPEARARHLAASVERPDEDVAAALEVAAQHARARGAPRAAALLLDRARDLTPDDRPDDALRRAVDGANLHFESGDSVRAEAQLHDVIDQLPPGRKRAKAFVRLGRVRSFEAQAEGAELFLRAVEEAEGDPEVLTIAHEGVAACFFRLRERLGDAVEHGERAAALALDLGDEALAGEALGSRFLPETLLGREEAAVTVERALALQAAAKDSRVLGQPRCVACVHWWWTDALERARVGLLEMLERAQELGDEASRPYVLVILGQVECALGELETALARAVEGQEASAQSGQHTSFVYNAALESLALAQLGRVEGARAAALRALDRISETGGRPAELVATGALGHLELALCDPEAAVDRLGSSVAFVRREHFGEPAAIRFVVDHIEALIELGRYDEAAEVLDWYEGHARRLGRASALASCWRCRGMFAAGKGKLEDAFLAYREALGWHAQVEIPLDRGRTLLALGVAQRRAKRRREARATLEEALAVFERVHAVVWAERAQGELRRISGRAPAPYALTPAEERVAALVAEGKTNLEVAEALFLSRRTVEGHLSRIFGKLGIRHRAELAPALASRQTQVSPQSNTRDTTVSVPPVAP